jgi:EAL and modified HD-GYP domain-containing signal transduction protein
MLGLRRVHGWVTLMVLSGLSDRPPELLATALLRARMCELLGDRLAPGRGATYFTTGLLSLLDVMLGESWADLAAHLPLSAEVMAAITGRDGELGRALDAVLHYERCEWSGVELPGVAPQDFRQAYLDSIAWSRRLLGATEIAAGTPAADRRRASS